MSEIDLLHKYPKSKRPVDERGTTVTEEIRNVSRKFTGFKFSFCFVDLEKDIL